MAKPIVLVYITANPWSVDAHLKAQEKFEKQFSDYHVLAVPSQRQEAIEVEVYNSKNLNAVGLKELKQKIAECLPKDLRTNGDTGPQQN